MKRENIKFVTENSLCFGCGACAAICPERCISFSNTNAGRLHPSINFNQCTGCGNCYAICPGYSSNNYITAEDLSRGWKEKAIGCYLGRSQDERTYKNSQSGGLVTQSLAYLFENHLIQYALVTKTDYARRPYPHYFWARSVNDLRSSQKSVYAPVALLSALRDIEDIKGDIAIVGLPCHIEGIVSLIKFHPQKFQKIRYKLGLICEGNLSLLATDYLSKKVNGEHKITYKNKHCPDYLNANITIEQKNETFLVVPAEERFLLKEFLTLPRCFLCPDKMNTYADLVFGDPWGVPGYDKIHGSSIVISRTTLGQDILTNMIKTNSVKLETVDYEQVLQGQKVSEKIRKVSSYALVYKNLGLTLPTYLSPFLTEKKIHPADQKRIIDFLRMETNSGEININIVVKIMARKLFQRKWQRFVKKIVGGNY